MRWAAARRVGMRVERIPVRITIVPDDAADALARLGSGWNRRGAPLFSTQLSAWPPAIEPERGLSDHLPPATGERTERACRVVTRAARSPRAETDKTRSQTFGIR